MVKLLIENNAEYDKRDKENNAIPLLYAIAYNFEDIVEYLLKNTNRLYSKKALLGQVNKEKSKNNKR